MINDKIIITLIVLTAVFSVGLLGSGISGMVIHDSNAQEACLDGVDCDSTQENLIKNPPMQAMLGALTLVVIAGYFYLHKKI